MLESIKNDAPWSEIVVWTDHKYLTYKNTEYASDRVLCRTLLLKEYAVQLKFIQWIKNDAVDMLSRNELVFEPTAIVSTTEFEAMMHKIHMNKMVVLVYYDIICLY